MVVFIVPNCDTAGAGLPRLSPDSRWQKKIMSYIVSFVIWLYSVFVLFSVGTCSCIWLHILKPCACLTHACHMTYLRFLFVKFWGRWTSYSLEGSRFEQKVFVQKEIPHRRRRHALNLHISNTQSWMYKHFTGQRSVGVGATNDTTPTALHTEKLATSSSWHQRPIQQTEKTRAAILSHVPIRERLLNARLRCVVWYVL